MALKNVKLPYESRESSDKLFNDHSSIVSESKYKVRHEEGIKTLTPNKCFKDYQWHLHNKEQVIHLKTY